MENIQEIIEKLEKETHELFSKDNSGHDIYHSKRVLNLALHLQEKEGGDRLVVAVTAFLHDIHRIIQKETGKFCSPKESIPQIREILKKIDFPKDKIDKVLHCIEFHEEYSFSPKGKTVNDIETLILQDADNLDAIGAIGVGRTFYYCGANQIPMWLPEIPFNRENYEESDTDVSTIHHFYTKLLNIKQSLNTKTAKKIGKQRHKFLEDYLKRFFKEWKGKD